MKPNLSGFKPKFARKNRETILPSKVARFVNDIAAICLFAVAAMLSLSLFSHSAYDNCWSRSFDTTIVHNKLGVLGAYLSDLLFYVFGLSAWWLVFGLFFLGFRKITRAQIHAGNWYVILKIMSYICLVFASTVLEYVLFYNHNSSLPDGFGGSLGFFIYHASHHFLGEAGVVISSLLLIVVCISFSFSVSWLYVAEKVGLVLEFIIAQLTKLVARKDNTQNITPEQINQQNLIKENIEEKISANTSNVGMKKYFTACTQFFQRQVTQETSTDNKDNFMDFNPQDPLFANAEQLPTHEPLVFDVNEDYSTQVPLAPPTSATTKLRVHGLKSAIKTNHVSNVDLLDSANKSTLPTTTLLNLPRVQNTSVSSESIEFIAKSIENTLVEFGLEASICNIESGPVVTRYELVPPKGVRGEKIAGLSKEIARALAMPSVRIVENILGKNTMAIEVPNFKRQTIYLKEIFDSAVYQNNSSLLTLALGKDISGESVIVDLAKMPHLLVAGTTGSGKSVAINVMILSILFNATPQEVKFIMIDPKMVELSFYQDIPHLLAPVVTDMAQAANALKWVVGEMEQRYRIMAKTGTKNISSFNQKIKHAQENGTPLFNPYSPNPEQAELLSPWPYIVVIIDELADLMMVAGKKIEQYIARIAQKARAVGIHLIVATQRPSVDVITGLIKANIPARISFQVSSKIDSRTILDQQGAESLLGQGDMLFLTPGSGFPLRIHGALVNDDELHQVVDYLKQQAAPEYNQDILNANTEVVIPGFEDENNEGNLEKDPVYDQAVNFILQSKRCSISSLQTQFGIGYNKAARIMNNLEKVGMVRRTERGSFELVNNNN